MQEKAKISFGMLSRELAIKEDLDPSLTNLIEKGNDVAWGLPVPCLPPAGFR